MSHPYELRTNPKPTYKNTNPLRRRDTGNTDENSSDGETTNRPIANLSLETTDFNPEPANNMTETEETNPTSRNTTLGLYNQPQITETSSQSHTNFNLETMFTQLLGKMDNLRTELKEDNAKNTAILRTELEQSHDKLCSQIEQTNIRIEKFEQKLQDTNDRLDKINLDLTQDLHDTNTKISSLQQQSETTKQQLETQINNTLIETKEYTQILIDETINKSQNEMMNYTDMEISRISNNLKSIIEENISNNMKLTSEMNHAITTQQNILSNHRNIIETHSIQIDELQTNLTQINKDMKEGTNNQLNNLPEIIIQHLNSTTTDHLPKFNNKNRNPKEFIKSLDEYYNNLIKRKGSREFIDYFELVEQCLEGPTAHWWTVVKEDIHTEAEFKTRFLNQYWNSETQRGIKRRIEMGKYRSEGRMTRTEYFIEKVLILKNITPPIHETDIVQIVGENFSDRIRDAMRVQNVQTIQEFLELLNREDIMEQNNMTRNSNIITRPTQNGYPNRPNQRSPDTDQNRDIRNKAPHRFNNHNYYESSHSSQHNIPERTHNTTWRTNLNHNNTNTGYKQTSSAPPRHFSHQSHHNTAESPRQYSRHQVQALRYSPDEEAHRMSSSRFYPTDEQIHSTRYFGRRSRSTSPLPLRSDQPTTHPINQVKTTHSSDKHLN